MNLHLSVSRVFRRIAGAGCALAVLAAPLYAQEASDLVKVELVAEPAAIRPGEPFTIGIKLTTKEHWHTYWRNPGDSGEPTTVTWKLPRGLHGGRTRMAGAVAHQGRAGDKLRL